MVPLIPFAIIQMLALYAALKPVNESYALIAVVLGIIGNILILTARPVVEMMVLERLYLALLETLSHSIKSGYCQV
jgi:hypothetical protein